MKPCICSNRGHRASILARSAETSPRDRPQGTLTRPSHDRLCLTSHGHVTCFVLQLQIAMPEGAGGFSPLRMGRKIRAFRPGFEQFSTSATVGSEAVEDKPASDSLLLPGRRGGPGSITQRLFRRSGFRFPRSRTLRIGRARFCVRLEFGGGFGNELNRRRWRLPPFFERMQQLRQRSRLGGGFNLRR